MEDKNYRMEHVFHIMKNNLILTSKSIINKKKMTFLMLFNKNCIPRKLDFKCKTQLISKLISSNCYFVNNSKKQKTYFKCSDCGVGLCVDKDCFKKYHIEQQ